MINHPDYIPPDDLPDHHLAAVLTMCRQLRDGGVVVTARDSDWARAMSAGKLAGLLRVARGPKINQLTARLATPAPGRRGK